MEPDEDEVWKKREADSTTICFSKGGETRYSLSFLLLGGLLAKDQI